MGLRVIKEVNRMPGNTVLPGQSILRGHVVEIDSNDQVKLYDGTGTPQGLAADTNVPFPLQNPTGPTAGLGFDYTDFNRGGLVGFFLNGGVFELFDDGRGHPVDTTQSYSVGQTLHAKNDGRVTSDSAAGPRIGRVLKVVGSGSTLKLTMVLEI
jgi:hypothetical protein